MFQPDIPPPSKLFWWQWYGRQAFLELRNDFRFPRKLHRVVYHLADAVKAPDKDTAAREFRELFPEAKTTSIFCIGEVK